MLAEPPHPGRPGRARRRKDEGAPEVGFLVSSDRQGGQQVHTRAPVHACEGVDSAVGVDALIRESTEFRKYTLGLPERVAEQDGGDASLAIRAPPAMNLFDNPNGVGPPVDG